MGAEKLLEVLPVGSYSSVDDLTPLSQDRHLALPHAQINATMVHGWPPLKHLRLERVQCGQHFTTPEGGQPFHPILEIALRFPQHPQPKPKVFQPHNQPVHQIGAASTFRLEINPELNPATPPPV